MYLVASPLVERQATSPEEAAKVGHASLIYLTCLTSVLIYDRLSILLIEYRVVWRPLLSREEPKRRDALRVFQKVWTLLFVVVRYGAMLEFSLLVWSAWTTYPNACKHFYRWDSYMSARVVLAANCIMALRVLALWGRATHLEVLLGLLLVTQAAVLYWRAYYVIPQRGVPFYIAAQTNKNLNALYIAPMMFDVIMLSMTMYKTFSVLGRGTDSHKLYFLGVFTCNLLATAFELQNAQPALQPINASLAIIGTSILCLRIFLNLKQAVREPWSRNLHNPEPGRERKPEPDTIASIASGNGSSLMSQFPSPSWSRNSSCASSSLRVSPSQSANMNRDARWGSRTGTRTSDIRISMERVHSVWPSPNSLSEEESCGGAVEFLCRSPIHEHEREKGMSIGTTSPFSDYLSRSASAASSQPSNSNAFFHDSRLDSPGASSTLNGDASEREESHELESVTSTASPQHPHQAHLTSSARPTFPASSTT